MLKRLRFSFRGYIQVGLPVNLYVDVAILIPHPDN